ncbi:hypothetical protein ABLG96_17230 [Nakamurella sp. A5-74]|uniref:TfoX N-terminal domain-containing protein n=1 Tax=Nakamurella sp. A5-74 TaxID=3158264 RepID=A0AAU8DKZ9_9ACTN
MTLDAAGRAQRARGQDLLDRLAEPYRHEEDLGRSTMFGSTGLNHLGSIVGFVGLEGQLVVKLDPAGLRDVRTAGPTVPVHIGRGIAKAWIGLPFGGDPDTARRWSEALAAGVSAARASVTA